MPRIKINSTTIERIKRPSRGQVFYWDTDLKGFGVKAMPTGLAFVVQKQINGKAVRQSIGNYPELTYKQARDKVIEALPKLRTKEQDKTKQKTLAEVYADFRKERVLKPSTAKLYDGNLSRCLEDWLDKPLSSITKDMVIKQHRLISDTPGVRGDRKAMADQTMRQLRTIFNFAADTYDDAEGKSLFPENPVKTLTVKKAWNKAVKRQGVIQPTELRDWYTAVMALENIAVKDYLLLLLFTGLRRTEAMRLTWANVDYKKTKTLTVPGTDTKNGDEHCLPLSDFLITLLKKRFANRRLDNPYVFSAEEGNKHIVEPKRKIAQVIKASEVDFCLHDLRRTFITTGEHLDIAHYALKKLINHRLGGDVTSQYTVITPERLRQPMQKIADYFKQQCGIESEEKVGANG